MRGLAEILRQLTTHDVDFIVVGGMAAALQGAPVQTFDLDVVYALDAKNVDRVLAALAALNARFRNDPRDLAPQRSHLATSGHKLLRTDHGPLDVLGTIEDDTTYEQLIADTCFIELEGMRIAVLTLERLIIVKEKLSRPKDQAMLLVLRATLDERNRPQ